MSMAAECLATSRMMLKMGSVKLERLETFVIVIILKLVSLGNQYVSQVCEFSKSISS